MEDLLINGLIGGLIATIVMTIAQMRAGGDNPPPTAIFWSKYIGDAGPEAYMAQGMILHFLYGIGAGGAFGVLVYLLDFDYTDALLSSLAGLGYGVLLFIVAAALWMKIVLDLDADRPMVIMFLIFHLIYGLVLGLWISLDLISL